MCPHRKTKPKPEPLTEERVREIVREEIEATRRGTVNGGGAGNH